MGPLIDTASVWTQDQMGRDSWSTMCHFGLRIESAGKASRPHSSSEPGPSRAGELAERGTLDPGPRWPG